MIVGLLTLELYMSDKRSLKEKRMTLKSLKDQLRRQFNISVAEVDGQNTWQRSTFGVVSVGQNRAHVNGQLSHVVDWVERQRTVELSDYSLMWL